MILLKFIQWGALFLSEYLKEDKGEILIKDLKFLYGQVRIYRKVLRLLNFVKLFQDIYQISSKKCEIQCKLIYVISKLFFAFFYAMDNFFIFYISAKGIRTKFMKEIYRKYWRYAYGFYFVGINFSLLFHGLYLKESYKKELNLKKHFVDKLTPNEVLNCLQNLSHERKHMYLNITKLSCDLIISLHFSGISERLLNTKIHRLFLSSCGILASICEIVSLSLISKEIKHNNKILALTLS